MATRRRTIPLPVLTRMVKEQKTQEQVEREMEEEQRRGKSTSIK